VRIVKELASATEEALGGLGARFRCDSRLMVAYLLVTVKLNLLEYYYSRERVIEVELLKGARFGKRLLQFVSVRSCLLLLTVYKSNATVL
jgi:hypothetical protein